MTGVAGAMPADLRARIAAIESRFDPATSTATTATATDAAAAVGGGDTLSLFQSLLTRALGGGTADGAVTTTDLTTELAGAASSATSTVGAPSSATVSKLATDGRYGQFAGDLLDRLGMPRTTENMASVVAWARAEGTGAANNPLATTQRMGAGETSFNGVGVKNYPSYEVGLDATVRTLRNGRYDEVLAALSRGDSAESVGRAVAGSPWGTGQGVLRVLGKL